jgi:hypothetical protein
LVEFGRCDIFCTRRRYTDITTKGPSSSEHFEPASQNSCEHPWLVGECVWKDAGRFWKAFASVLLARARFARAPAKSFARGRNKPMGGPNKKVTPHSAATLPLKMESSSATDRVSRPAPPYGATFRYPFQVLQKRFFRQSLRNVHLPPCGGAFRYPAEVGTETILQTALHGIHTSAVSPR